MVIRNKTDGGHSVQKNHFSVPRAPAPRYRFWLWWCIILIYESFHFLSLFVDLMVSLF